MPHRPGQQPQHAYEEAKYTHASGGSNETARLRTFAAAHAKARPTAERPRSEGRPRTRVV
ncbi:hypothetical protein [Deinococcus alpinitundrae]|uniref:hypothetical protein n=1 Tax=Deinococcus alpinitundrae TaxID=468913 RepID=UPI001379A1CF|nr:hypothetical protein [Deinococcus alpinitundrae]